jgi:hypothetical protein
MNLRAASWLDGAGFDVPRQSNGEPDGVFEISPLLAIDAAHLREVMVEPPVMVRGNQHYWE